MEKINPYSLMFGKEPIQMISRIGEMDEITRNFLADPSPQQIYMITGVRGSGKTVQMTEISKKIASEKDWLVVELNPETNLLEDLAAKLYNEKSVRDIFKKAKINLSFWGIGVELDQSSPITNIEVAVSELLEQVKKHKKRLLITIDEATNSESMRIFASAYQIFVRKDYPVYLLMTGLYENIDALQNEKSMTFLHRAPKVYLGALNIGSIARQYKKTFDLSDEQSREMARMTRGYSFAFQALGYCTFEKKGDYQEALDTYLEYLDEYVYNKIWSELTAKEKMVLHEIANCENAKTSEIREKLGMKPNELSPYRDRLVRRGIINGEERGVLKLTLPYFEDYILNNYY
ncbi:MAG: ATP-binding protein [Eubacterium sp.]|nr:ATP-binding protein [Eubacterium sp.]